jgi:hypothetical protein
MGPTRTFTHHGAGDYRVDEDGNLIVPAKAEAKLCEALQS